LRVAVGSDHAGYRLKEEIKCHLSEQGHDVHDFGTFSLDAVDYPDFALRVAKAVAGGDCELGVLACGTGLGMCIAANKVRGVRAALCHDEFSARSARRHNDANVLTLGARVVGNEKALSIVDAWLAARFEAGRHERRVRKILEIERCEGKDEA